MLSCHERAANACGSSNVQLEGASTTALFLNFLLEPLRAFLVMNIDTLKIAVCDQRQNILRRLVLRSLTRLAEPGCNRTRRDDEGLNHLWLRMIISDWLAIDKEPDDSSPCRHDSCRDTWVWFWACQGFEAGANVGSMASQRGRGTCHIPSQNGQ